MLADDEVASSVASCIPTINQQTIEQTGVMQEVVSPEVIKLNQSLCNEQKQGDHIQFSPEKKTIKTDNGFITCQPIIPVDGLCYGIIH